jgi:hypothetical protein
MTVHGPAQSRSGLSNSARDPLAMPSTKRATRLKPRVSRIAISATGCPGELGDRLCQAARFTLARNGIMRGELEIAVVGGREMRQLHKQWLGDAGATFIGSPITV